MSEDMKKLTTAEEEIMQIIWRLGPCTVRQVREDIGGNPLPPHSSISTIVRILEQKGFVDHKAYGRTYEYRPLISKDDYRKFELQNLARDYFDGSMNRLVSFLVKEAKLAKDDLEDLLDRLDNA